MDYVDFHGYKVYRDGTIIGRKGKEVHPYQDSKGYLRIDINMDGTRKTRKTYKVHRIVAQCFIPNPDNKPQVNHINGIKTDNRAENLEWCTNAENQKHAVRTGLRTVFPDNRGERNGQHKLSVEDVKYIRAHYKRYSKDWNSEVLAKKFNVGDQAILDIITGRRWNWLS